MTAKSRSVFGIYHSVAQVEKAVNALIADGFASQDVSALIPDHSGPGTLVHRKETKAPEGASAGATTGGVLGGALGVLVGLGALAIPGVGPLIAAGPIVAGLAGIGAGGAVGGLIGALVGLGIPEYEARRYEGRVKEGGVLLSVHCETPGEVLRAKEILDATGAGDVASSAERAGASAERREPPTEHVEASTDGRVASAERVPAPSAHKPALHEPPPTRAATDKPERYDSAPGRRPGGPPTGVGRA